MSDLTFRAVVVIPCRLHAKPLTMGLPAILSSGLSVIIVDDGDSAEESKILASLESDNVYVIKNNGKHGKGVAVQLGFEFAAEHGFTHALQIDADGQHDPESLVHILTLALRHPQDLICAVPLYDKVPMGRFLARYITHFWVAVELGKCKVIDSMCGLRAYPLAQTLELMHNHNIGTRMAFDTEIMVRLYWAGVNFCFLPVKVTYPDNGISNFAPFKDNVMISLMHTKLCLEKIFHFWAIHKRIYR